MSVGNACPACRMPGLPHDRLAASPAAKCRSDDGGGANSSPQPSPSMGEGEVGSELLEQTADVVQLVLRAGAVGAAAAQFLLDRLGALLLALLGHRGGIAFVGT